MYTGCRPSSGHPPNGVVLSVMLVVLIGTGGGTYDTGHTFEVKGTAEETWDSVCTELITHFGKTGFILLRNSHTRVRTVLTGYHVVCIALPTTVDVAGET